MYIRENIIIHEHRIILWNWYSRLFSWLPRARSFGLHDAYLLFPAWKDIRKFKTLPGACAALAALAVHTKSTEYHTIRRTRRGNTILIVVMMEASHLYKTSIQLIRRWARFKSSRSTKTPLERRPKRQLQLVQKCKGQIGMHGTDTLHQIRFPGLLNWELFQ